MDKLLKRARRESGLAAYERDCGRKTRELGRLKQAWRVPGTRENGQWTTLMVRCNDLLAKYRGV